MELPPRLALDLFLITSETPRCLGIGSVITPQPGWALGQAAGR